MKVSRINITKTHVTKEFVGLWNATKVQGDIVRIRLAVR